MNLAVVFRTVVLKTCFSIFIGSSIPIALSENPLPNNSAVVENKVVWTDLGQNASVLCKSPNSEPLQECFWEKTNSDKTVATFHVPATYEQISLGYSYYGRGFPQGDCGITIESIESKDFGDWSCNIVMELCTTLTGTVQVFQMVKPEILNKEELKELQDSQNGTAKMNLTCCINSSTNGTTPPDLHFQLDSGSAQIEANSEHTQNNLLSCIIWVDAIFTYQQNGHDLRCRADYASYPKTSAISEPMKLNIAFPPRVENLTGETRIRISKLKKMFNITLVAWANPFPTVKVNLQSKGESSPREITEFTSLSSVYVIEVINNFPSDQVTIFLRLLDSGRVKDEDKITVSVKNALGKEETTFIFVSDKTDIVDTLCISLFIAIIILVMGILLIIVLVVVAPSRCRHNTIYKGIPLYKTSKALRK